MLANAAQTCVEDDEMSPDQITQQMSISPSDDRRDRGRRWYNLRPQPRRRGDLMGSTHTLWMGVGWVIVVLALIFPFPWWW